MAAITSHLNCCLSCPSERGPRVIAERRAMISKPKKLNQAMVLMRLRLSPALPSMARGLSNGTYLPNGDSHENPPNITMTKSQIP